MKMKVAAVSAALVLAAAFPRTASADYTYTLESGGYVAAVAPGGSYSITGTITVSPTAITGVDLVLDLGGGQSYTFNDTEYQNYGAGGVWFADLFYNTSVVTSDPSYILSLDLNSAGSLFAGLGATIATGSEVYGNPGGYDFGTPYGTFAAAAPEPSTWAMAILGFGAVGVMAYRRRSKPAWTAG